MAKRGSRVQKIQYSPSTDFYNNQFEAGLNFYKKRPWFILLVIPFILFFIGVLVYSVIQFNNASKIQNEILNQQKQLNNDFK